MQKLKLFLVALVCVTMTVASFAQTGSTGSSSSNTTTSGDPRPLSDQTMSSKLQSDLRTRNSQLGSTNVQWFDTGNGYYGTYTMDDKDYMVRYDKKGNYQDSYTKGDWDDSSVPSSLKSAYGNSQYKDQDVTGFWQSSDRNRKGYYMELRDKQGKNSRIWADDKGKFSNNAPTASSDSRSNP